MLARSLVAKSTLPLLAFALSGCALNALRVEYAGDVSAKGKAAMTLARDYLGTAAKTRRAANLEIIGLDPNCYPDIAYLRDPPRLDPARNFTDQAAGWLCLSAEEAAALDADRRDRAILSLAPAEREIQPTLRLIEGLSAYFGAIDRILADDGDDFSKDFTDSIGLLRSGEKMLAALGVGKAAKLVPDEKDARLAAVGELAKFLETLAREKHKVEELRKLVAKDPHRKKLVEDLITHLRAWEWARDADQDHRTTSAYMAMITIKGKDNAPVSGEVRRKLAEIYYDRAAEQIESGKLFPALDTALTALAEADAELRDTLGEHPNLDAKERAKLARILRDRLTKAFDIVAALILSFKGA